MDRVGRFEALTQCPLEGEVNLQVSYTADGLIAVAKYTEQKLEGRNRKMFLRGSLEFSPEDLPHIIQALTSAYEKTRGIP